MDDMARFGGELVPVPGEMPILARSTASRNGKRGDFDRGSTETDRLSVPVVSYKDAALAVGIRG